MKNDTSNNTAKTILGFFTAAAIGAAIGIAYAPHKGTVTRKKVKKKVNTAAKDALSYVEDTKDSTVAKANELIELGRDTAQDLKAKATKKIAEIA